MYTLQSWVLYLLSRHNWVAPMITRTVAVIILASRSQKYLNTSGTVVVVDVLGNLVLQ